MINCWFNLWILQTCLLKRLYHFTFHLVQCLLLSKLRSYFTYVCIHFLCDRVPCRPGWPHTCYVVEGILQFLILLSPSLEFWDKRHAALHLVYVVLRKPSRILCMLDEQSENWSKLLDPSSHFLIYTRIPFI